LIVNIRYHQSSHYFVPSFVNGAHLLLLKQDGLALLVQLLTFSNSRLLLSGDRLLQLLRDIFMIYDHVPEGNCVRIFMWLLLLKVLAAESQAIE
jgi:hypothetical protein